MAEPCSSRCRGVRGLSASEISFVSGRESCRMLCSALATDTWKVKFGWPPSRTSIWETGEWEWCGRSLVGD